jgi:hypothetical protein
VEYLKAFQECQAQFAGRAEPIPEPILNADLEPEYELAAVRGHKLDRNGKLRLLCHWAGYETFDDTWEPEANLSNSQEMLNAYKREHDLA